MIEDIRKYTTVTFCKNQYKTQKEISKTNYDTFKIISKDIVAVFKKLPVLKLNKPLQIGFTILERSKDFMYLMYYNNILPSLNNYHVSLLMTDTDSLMLKYLFILEIA